jgi:hypothetical protein
MYSGYRLGKGFSWTDDGRCPSQLVAEAGQQWYISGSRIDHFEAFSGCSAGKSAAVWTADGTCLYLIDDAYRLQRIVFSAGTLPRYKEDRTPPEWIGKKPLLFSGCAPRGRSGLYCVVFFRSELRLPPIPSSDEPMVVWPATDVSESLWLLPDAQPSQAQLVMDSLPPVSSQLWDSPQGPSLVRDNYRRLGDLHVTNLDTGSSAVYEVAKQRVQLTSFSYAESRCTLSSYDALRSLDLRTGAVDSFASMIYGSMSPDGSLIAGMRSNDELLLLDLASKETHSVLSARSTTFQSDRPYEPIHCPQWSSDGNWLVFALYRWEGLEPGLASENQGAARLDVVECDTLVLNLAKRSIFPLPFFSQRWVWRPSE